jgi:hypothetical protein
MPLRSREQIRWRRLRKIAILTAVLLSAAAVWMVITRTSTSASSPTVTTEVGRKESTEPADNGARPEPSASTARRDEPCDEGQVPVREGILEASAFVRAAAGTALSKLAGQLATAADQKDRALGLFLQPFDLPVHSESNAECDEQCLQETSRASERRARRYTDALAQLASTSNRADVYALAFYRCHSVGIAAAEGSCSLLSAERWAQIEPGNAAPWLFAADDAAQRGDRSGQAEAYFRASKAAAFDSRLEVFADVLDSDAGRSLAPDVQATIGLDLVGILAAIPTPGISDLLRTFCGDSAVSEPNRRQVCSDVAQLMTERSNSDVNLHVGIRLGERVGWPLPRLNALRDERDAMMQLESERLPHQGSRCEPYWKLQTLISDILRFGDIGIERGRIASSGRSVAQLAEAWRASHKPETEHNPPASLSTARPLPR